MMPPDQAALHGQDPGDHPGHNGHIPMPETCLAATVATITGRASIITLKIFLEVCQPGHLAQDQGQGHGDEAGQGRPSKCPGH